MRGLCVGRSRGGLGGELSRFGGRGNERGVLIVVQVSGSKRWFYGRDDGLGGDEMRIDVWLGFTKLLEYKRTGAMGIGHRQFGIYKSIGERHACTIIFQRNNSFRGRIEIRLCSCSNAGIRSM